MPGLRGLSTRAGLPTEWPAERSVYPSTSPHWKSMAHIISGIFGVNEQLVDGNFCGRKALLERSISQGFDGFDVCGHAVRERVIANNFAQLRVLDVGGGFGVSSIEPVQPFV